jgi:uncharacterized cupredoxin-like copper-binding protein
MSGRSVTTPSSATRPPSRNHEKEMRDGKMDDHGGDAITVDPGRTGELVHTFTSGQSVLIGCHEAGHYAAGMKITVSVT